MIIETPNNYQIEITAEEKRIFQECRKKLEAIVNNMEKLGCELLMWEEDGNQIYVEQINNMITNLENLPDMNIMY